MKRKSRDSLVKAIKLTGKPGGGPRVTVGRAPVPYSRGGIDELFRREMLTRRVRLDKWLQLIEKECGGPAAPRGA